VFKPYLVRLCSHALYGSSHLANARLGPMSNNMLLIYSSYRSTEAIACCPAHPLPLHKHPSRRGIKKKGVGGAPSAQEKTQTSLLQSQGRTT
jgi:hypothetical protein